MSAIKNIIFDVSEVLTMHQHDQSWSNQLLADEYGVPIEKIQAFFDEYIEAGRKVHGMRIEEFLDKRTVDLGPIPISAILASGQRYANDIVLNMEMIHVLEKLHKSYRLFALTNTWKPGHPFKKDLEQYFEAFVQSCDIYLSKPDPAVFQHMIDTYSLIPEETLFIDNRIENTAAAEKLGMKTIHFVGAEQCIEDLRKLGVLE